MILNIILEDNKKDYQEMYEKIGGKIHNSLAGNKDYVDCNIVLNLDEKPIMKEGKETDEKYAECNVYFSGNDCADKEYIRVKAKEAVDLFIDSLEE